MKNIYKHINSFHEPKKVIRREGEKQLSLDRLIEQAQKNQELMKELKEFKEKQLGDKIEVLPSDVLENNDGDFLQRRFNMLYDDIEKREADTYEVYQDMITDLLNDAIETQNEKKIKTAIEDSRLKLLRLLKEKFFVDKKLQILKANSEMITRRCANTESDILRGLMKRQELDANMTLPVENEEEK